MALIHLLQALLGVLAFVILYNKWLPKSQNSNKSKTGGAVPQPAGAWPLLGHLPLLGGTEPMFRKFGAMADKYGPIFMLRLGMNRALVVSSWEIAKECFTTNDKALASRPNTAVGELVCYNNAAFGIAPYGQFYRDMRKIAMHEMLSNAKLESLKHIRVGQIGKRLQELQRLWVENRQQPIFVDMKQWFEDLTFNIIITMIAGERYCNVGVGGRGEADRVQRSVRDMATHLGVFVPSDSFPFLKWYDFQGQKEAMRRTSRQMDSMAVKWLEEHRQRRAAAGKDEEPEEARDFIDVMLSALKDEKIHGHDRDSIIKGTALTLTTAGTDTTAISMGWAFSLLLNHPSSLEKAREELDLHVGKTRNVEDSDMKNLVYLQAVIKETLRLYPPAPLSIPHEASEDCYVGGYHVPAGTRLFMNLWKLHRDPTIWSDPDEFQPERFLTKHANLDFRGQCFEYLPFGSGRRLCPGINLAQQVMSLTLARLVHGFDIVTVSGGPIDMKEGISISLNKEGPVQVLVSPRLPSHLYSQE